MTMDKLKMLARACPLERVEEWGPDRLPFTHCDDRAMVLVRAAAAAGHPIITTSRPDLDATRRSAVKLGYPMDEFEQCVRNWPEVAALASVVIPYDAAPDHPAVLTAKALL